MKKINITKIFSFVLLAAISSWFVACENDDKGKYQITDGEPTIHYVRLPDPAKADSLLSGAFMGETVCLIGENLTSIKELYFNDQKALLNINFITNHTLFVTVPRDVPGENTDKIYMTLKSGKQVDYDFTVRVPGPELTKIKCELLPEGADAVLYGDYFFETGLKVLIGDYEVPAEDIVSIEKTKLTFKAPASDVTGQISVTTAFGVSARTKAVFNDARGWITGFEDDFVGGWGRPSGDRIQADPAYSFMGNYAIMTDKLDPGDDGSAWVSGGNSIINIWGEDNGVPTGNLFPSDPASSVLKFEVNVVEAWTGTPIIFAFFAQGGMENYLWADGTATGDGQPRAFWAPWVETGSYVSDGWETVSIPLSEFKYNGFGVEVPLSTFYGSFGMNLHNRGNSLYVGKACTPLILIDNIRVVPGE